MTSPLTAAGNLAAKAWRRGSVVPKASVRIARRARRIRERFDALRDEWAVERELAALARGDRPVLAGPWLSEVGFEVLYWIPFLRWLEDRHRVDRERVIAVSRGGVAAWYGDVAGGYVDIFDRVDPETFARRNAERRAAGEAGGQKQTNIGAFDAELLAAVGHAAATDAAVWHPSLMYRLLTPFWLGNRALDLVTSHTRHLRLSLPRPADIDLPERYVAVKFYTGAALPDTPGNRRALHDLVSVVARRIPVVVLDTGMTTDEHEDYLFRGVPNVFDVRKHLTARTNLGVQTSVIAGAEGFIGTCGSLAWLAPMLGVDTIAVYADERFLLSHILFATHVYRQTGAARFDTLDLNALVQLDLTAAAESVAARRPPGG